MFIEKLLKRKRYLKMQRVKEAVLTGLIFGAIVGIIFGSVATIRSASEGLFLGLIYGGALGIIFGFGKYLSGSNQFPEELYIKCKVKRGMFEYDRDITLTGGVEITDVHKSAIITENEPKKGEELEGYVKAGRDKGKLFVRAGDMYAGARPVFVNVPRLDVITV